MKRRVLIQAGLLVAIPSLPGFAQQSGEAAVQILGELPPLPSDLAGFADEPPAPYVATEPVGTARPTDDEVRRAYEILVNSPFGPQRTTPIGVAQYFLEVARGVYGEEKRPFAREWPIRANPLIFHMFASTETKPEGDTTAWCAAFLNWCILRSHAGTTDEIGKSPGSFSRSGAPFPVENLQRFSTNHASSGSFRCWADTPSPARGDICIFKDPGTDTLTAVCRGTGHVAFVLEHPGPRGEGWVQLLGGNQSERGSNGAVTVANWQITRGSRFMNFVRLKG